MTAAGGSLRTRTPPRRDRSLDWDRDRATWPNHEASRFVEVGDIFWHVQVMGEGPVLLLVHGTGASTHSFRDMMPKLAQDFTVVAPDLPGHAFTSAPSARHMSLPGMAAGLRALLSALHLEPAIVAGHSAGAAILARLCLDGAIVPAGLVALNGAFLPIGGIAGQVFSPLAKIMASTPILPHLFARWASDRDAAERLIGQTGSVLSPEGLALYGRLMRSPAHAAGALSMMAGWDLQPLVRQLPQLTTPLVLVVGSRDGSVPPADAFRVRDRVSGSRIETLKGLGHLAHEEAPGVVTDLIDRYARIWGVVGDTPPAA